MANSDSSKPDVLTRAWHNIAPECRESPRLARAGLRTGTMSSPRMARTVISRDAPKGVDDSTNARGLTRGVAPSRNRTSRSYRRSGLGHCYGEDANASRVGFPRVIGPATSSSMRMRRREEAIDVPKSRLRPLLPQLRAASDEIEAGRSSSPCRAQACAVRRR